MAPPRNPRRRPAEDDDAPQFGRKKTVKMNPVAAIFLFVTPVILFGVFIYLYVNRNAPKNDDQVVAGEENPDHWYDIFKKDMRKADKMYREAMTAQRGEDPKKFKRLWDEAMKYVDELATRLDGELKDYKDEHGILLEDYSGYNEAYNKLDTLRSDLLKSAPFDLDD